MRETKNKKRAQLITDYQARASEFAVGTRVAPIGVDVYSHTGEVKAVFPAIGMVDVEFAWGSQRFPVEDLNIIEDAPLAAPQHDSIPGGPAKVSVPGGPTPKTAAQRQKTAKRVAEAFVMASITKNALYWGDRDRKYRATKRELGEGNYFCPKHRDVPLRPAVFMRENGKSLRLMGCPECMFLIRRDDICHEKPVVNVTVEIEGAE